MKFIIAIEPGDDAHAFGVVAPDLPGCFSAGDTLDEAIDKAKEAIDFHCQILIEDDGGMVPAPRTLAEHQADPDFAGWIWAVVEVPVERYFGPAESQSRYLRQPALRHQTVCHSEAGTARSRPLLLAS